MEQNTINYGSYTSFREMMDELSENLNQLKIYCGDLGLDNTAKSISDTVEKNAKERFEVAIVGEFKRGKSTLINALLGQEVLPADVLPATATLNRVTYSSEPYVMVEFKNGESERVDIEHLADYVTKLSYESEKMAETVKEATVYYDTDFCKNHVDIIDTPGLNDDEQMTNVTLSILPEIDAAVFVISANSPFSQFEKEFLEKKMLTSDLGRIIFAVNCFGTFSKEDEDRIVDTIEKRICSYVMEKAKKVMGENSKEFDVYKRKIGKPKVIGVYAKKALMAKENNDAAMLEESNFPKFESVLETMLTQERGAISLQILANKIISSGSEVINAIVLRENALMMENDEFMEKYQLAIDEIEDIRTKKREEFVRINDAANRVFEKLQPILDDYWVQIEETAMQVIDDYQMSADDLKREKMKIVYERLTDKIKENIENKAQLICEQIQNDINVGLSDEATRLQTFEDEFFASINRIQEMFRVNTRSARNSGAVDSVIGSVIGSVGIGGLFIGFREAGIKGALLGGLTGLTAWVATSFVLVSAVAGGMFLSPAGLCIMAIAGLAGTFTGKFSVDKFLVQERIDKFKNNFKTQVKKQFHEMKINSDFTETVRRQVYNSFSSLKERIEEETEVILKDTQKTLDSLNEQKAKKKEFSDNEKMRLQNIAEYTGSLLAETYNLHKSFADAMMDEE
ncbi:MAG: dynamin family protein [Oscillospiraceae bacterium]|nr:dynamin family protein [Oscillospiraceae bacterium]MDD7428427.1 dynamin family protein [Oscillospiraceae bacterium]MDY2847469.1 dynamin family protein [Oscillospiraceae bacterium]